MATEFINFRNYPQMTKCRIGQKILLHSTDFSNKYNTMRNLQYGDTPSNVTNMVSTYFYCTNLTGSPVCGPNVTSMYGTYLRCINLTGNPVCGNNVTSMYSTYVGCTNLNGSPVCGNNVTNMYSTYSGCTNLTGNPVCGNNVIDMGQTYFYCTNLTGSPVCGPNVIDMYQTYNNCTNLTGSPVCGPNVTSMWYTYNNCTNLTGSPVCGPNVTEMDYAYYNCTNLTGSPVCGPNVTDMVNTYANCRNLCGNMYMYSNNVSNMVNCFRGRNTSNWLNIFVHPGTISYNTLVNTSSNICGYPITWSIAPSFPNTGTGTGVYNDTYNITIFPVSNVRDTAKNNNELVLTEDAEIEEALNKDFTYTKYSNGIYEITGWNQTLNGVSSTICKVPNSNRIMI